MKNLVRIVILSFFAELFIFTAIADQIYTLSYDGNGVWLGEVFATQVKQEGIDTRLNSTFPSVNSTKTFQGWSSNPNATTPEYQPGDLYTKDESVTLYAIWRDAYEIGEITDSAKVTVDVDWVSFSVAEGGEYVITTNIVDTYSSRNGIYVSPIQNYYNPDYPASTVYPISMIAELEGNTDYYLYLSGPSRGYTLSIVAQGSQSNVSCGDINNDSVVDTRDVLMLMQHLAAWDVIVNVEAADVNKDTVVDMRDVLMLLKN